ncbi:MAG: DNA/RNA nuclease SfsA [Sedimentisphaerales bacterium]|nr:DNA/RNA nuclease SfsA [Sedimentisphaerales bacterium]
MKDSTANHYERAFENWLIDHRIEYVAEYQHERATVGDVEIKSFDFLLMPSSRPVIVEVKGRTFRGTSLAKMAGFECWVTTEDVDGLLKWQQVLGREHRAVFVFAYKMENVDVDFNGRDVFDFNANKYLFFCVMLEDYRKFMKRRSPKWQTVTLPADKFRQCAIPLDRLLFETKAL